MLTVTELTLEFGGSKLFKDVNLKFTPGNCYGVIGANGAGKSTLLKILSGELEPTRGEISFPKNLRMSVLKQDQFAYDEHTLLNAVIMGNPRLFEIMREKDEIYAKEDFTDEDGIKASELEGEFAELNGWEAETEAGRLLTGLGIEADTHDQKVGSLNGDEKVKVLLAQALFGNPDILLLDEPTNHLDVRGVEWLEDYLLDFPGTLIVVSHDRHFLNTVCTHTVDIDYNKIKMYVGNYDFWYESSKMVQQILRDQNKKMEEKIKDLQTFIQRFSANKSKSRQATSRKRLLDNMSVEDMPASSRRYPYVAFKPDRELGKEVLRVEGLTKSLEGETLLKDISLTLGREDKVVILSKSEPAISLLFDVLSGEVNPDAGDVKWGVTTTVSYFPKDNAQYFEDVDLNLVDWLRQYSKEIDASFIRGFLGRMLFSGDDALKPAKVLSGGEKVRMMLSKMMISGANVLMLNQPTNHLDLESITALNNGLTAFPGVVIFTSHDHQFIQTIANRVIEITEEGIIDRSATYDEYLALKG